MSGAIRILLTSQSDPKLAEALGRELIDTLDPKLRETFGGTCVGTKLPGGVIGEISGVEWSWVAPFIEAFEASITRKLLDVRLVISKDTPPLNENEREAGHALSTEPKKLTKALFLSLPTGVFLASNVCGRDLRSAFAEYVADGAVRATQWGKITELAVAQRLCRVFPSREKYLEWEADMWRLAGR